MLSLAPPVRRDEWKQSSHCLVALKEALDEARVICPMGWLAIRPQRSDGIMPGVGVAKTTFDGTISSVGSNS